MTPPDDEYYRTHDHEYYTCCQAEEEFGPRDAIMMFACFAILLIPGAVVTIGIWLLYRAWSR